MLDNLSVIYEDDDYTISMVTPLAKYIETKMNTSFQLEKIEIEEITDLALSYIKNKGISVKDKYITITSQCPIMNRSSFLNIFYLNEKFKCFEEALLLIDSAFSLTEGRVSSDWKRLMEICVTSYYSTQYQEYCDLYIFDVPHNNISGILTFIADSDIVILPFEINEDNKYHRIILDEVD